MTIFITIKTKGGPGSGNWGHRGIPGKVGGSAPRGAGLSPTSGKDWLQRYEKRTGKKHPDAPKPKPKSPVKPKPKRKSKYPADYPNFQAAGKELGAKYANGAIYGRSKKTFSAADKRQIATAMASLPESHLDAVASISDYRTDETFAGECASSGDINLIRNDSYGKLWSRSVVTHEIGHAVLFDAKPQLRGKVTRLYRDLLSKANVKPSRARSMARSTSGKPIRGFPSKYGQVDYQEMFAESYTMFLSNPAKLKRMAPEMYNVMSEVFTQ